MALAVVHHLRQAVVTGKLKPGDRIIERQLAAELNVSRTPIREGLKLLELDGLVDLSRICAAPSARLGHLAFEGQGAFASQC